MPSYNAVMLKIIHLYELICYYTLYLISLKMSIVMLPYTTVEWFHLVLAAPKLL